MDTALYEPSPLALERLEAVTFVAVVGPTAAGKTTLIRRAMQREPSLHLVLNNTSRARRPDEHEGVDYRFETREAMIKRIERGEYVQVAPTLFGDLYATAADDYTTDGIATLPVLADAIPVFRRLPFKKMRTVYVLPPDWDTWQARIALHKFTPEKRASRMQEAARSLHFALDDTHTTYVVSREGERATDDFIQAVCDRPYTPALVADQTIAKDIIHNLLQCLKKPK